MDLGFGDFRYREASGALERGEVEVPLTPKTRELLLLLVGHPGKTFSRDEISRAIWPEVVVTDNALSFQVAELRKALGDASYVRTIPRVGYRWDGPPVVLLDESGVLPKAAERRAAAAEPVPNPSSVRTRRAPALVAAAGLVVVALALVSVRAFRRPIVGEPQSATPEPVRLAVTPLVLIGEGEPDVGLGFADSLSIRLSLLPGLAVRSTSSVLAAQKGGELSTLELGKKLGVDVVVDGSVRRSAGAVEVRIRLLDVKSGHALATEAVKSADGDRLAVEERLAASLARALGLPLEKLAIERWSAPRSPDAAELYWRAQALSLRGWRANREGLRLLASALEIDPHFAAAHALRAQSLGLEVGYGVAKDPDANHREALREAREAVRLEPSNPYARSILGGAIADMGDIDAGAAEAFRARDEAPSRASIHMVLGWLYRWAGLLDRAAASYDAAFRLDPSLWRAGVHLAYVETLQGNEEAARRTLDRLAEFGATAETAALEMNAWRAYQRLDLDAADAACRAVAAREPVLQYCDRLAALVAARRGDLAPARVFLSRPGEASYSDGRRRFDRAALFAAVGEKDGALSELRSAERFGFQTPQALARDPDLAALARDPRFAALRERWEKRRLVRERTWR